MLFVEKKKVVLPHPLIKLKVKFRYFDNKKIFKVLAAVKFPTVRYQASHEACAGSPLNHKSQTLRRSIHCYRALYFVPFIALTRLEPHNIF